MTIDERLIELETKVGAIATDMNACVEMLRERLDALTAPSSVDVRAMVLKVRARIAAEHTKTRSEEILADIKETAATLTLADGLEFLEHLSLDIDELIAAKREELEACER